MITGMALKVVEKSWLPRSGGSETTASGAIMPVHRTAAPSHEPDRPRWFRPCGNAGSALLPHPLSRAPGAVEPSRIERSHLGVVHAPPQRTGVLLGLAPALRTRDGDGTLGDDPGQGDLARGGPAVGLSDPAQDLHNPVHRRHRMVRERARLGRRVGGAVLTGQAS